MTYLLLGTGDWLCGRRGSLSIFLLSLLLLLLHRRGSSSESSRSSGSGLRGLDLGCGRLEVRMQSLYCGMHVLERELSLVEVHHHHRYRLSYLTSCCLSWMRKQPRWLH